MDPNTLKTPTSKAHAAALAPLADLEWGPSGHVCPVCSGDQLTGHSPHCTLAALLYRDGAERYQWATSGGSPVDELMDDPNSPAGVALSQALEAAHKTVIDPTLLARIHDLYSIPGAWEYGIPTGACVRQPLGSRRKRGSEEHTRPVCA